MAKIDAFFNLMFEQKASDLHLSSNNNPMLRINGELSRVDHPPLDNDDLKKMLYEIAPEYKIKIFEETGDVDFGYEIPNISRFRANFFNQKYGIAAVLDRKSTRLNSSHVAISYAVFCLKKKNHNYRRFRYDRRGIDYRTGLRAPSPRPRTLRSNGSHQSYRTAADN